MQANFISLSFFSWTSKTGRACVITRHIGGVVVRRRREVCAVCCSFCSATGAGVAVAAFGHAATVFDLGLEGFEEPADHLIPEGVAGQHAAVGELQLYPEGECPRVLIECSLHRVVQALQVLTNERAFLVHDGQALVGVIVVDVQVVVLRVTTHGHVSVPVDS